MHGTYSFLKNQNIPAAIRLKVLQSVLIPIGTYGGELFGMSELANPIRQPLKHRSRIWVSGTLRWQKKYNINIEQTTERLAKSELISKIYREKYPCFNAIVSENYENILIDFKRWAVIRSKAIRQLIPNMSRSYNNKSNSSLIQAKIKLLSKLFLG
ncbi:hypothetical protein BB561_003740 [Smittium simulii]|uniref:Uncharacterized protein n=1 Tax=Smittium simulii TaxID=133385 RepID=A0A2T9YJS6_9FUNG|nr:hypothetical protein BB561_003740 [Smittium simulii]